MIRQKKCLRIQNAKMQGLGFYNNLILRTGALVISHNASVSRSLSKGEKRGQPAHMALRYREFWKDF